MSVIEVRFKTRETKNQRGQSLIEIIVAIGLIVATVTALLALAVMSLKTSGYGLMKARAVKVGNAMLEKARANRETMDWDTFLASHELLSLEGVDGSYAIKSLAGPGGSGDTAQVVVTVTWRDSSGDQQLEFVETMTNWR